ncbi:ribonuclease E/G [Roseomonas sp. SSH11]|uniref:Ribonuclease E/G n=1 Tax=Pararoseomonas baculiformis TaxID=2820812 RepID=A0ABS4AIA4_9PROT|nr:ribonuclease E/G [Pararoseomonas baculiformis]MBP0446718.1 ribonuclease E/G [Pararoseomonas baculiformis]
MTDTAILLSASPGERRVALWRDGRLDAAFVERPARPDGVGDVHLGRIATRVPALSGAFVALEGGASGFLPDAQGGEGLTEGTYLALRVTRAPQGGKGPRLAGTGLPKDLPRAFEGPPRLLRRGPDAALRLAAAHAALPVLTDSPREAARLRGPLGAQRVRLLPHPAFSEPVEAAFDELASPEIPLEGGGRLLIHPTPALTALDVDTGSAAGRSATAHRSVNAAALAEAARQIRLRHLAGPILLDLAGGSASSRAALLPALRSAASADPLLRVVGLTGLGLMEMVRTRIHPPLHEVLGQPLSPLTQGLAALRRAARESAARPGAALALRAHPTVLAALRELPGALEDYAAGAAHPISLRPDAALPPGAEIIEEAPHHEG